jgi:hypothetical protein
LHFTIRGRISFHPWFRQINFLCLSCRREFWDLNFPPDPARPLRCSVENPADRHADLGLIKKAGGIDQSLNQDKPNPKNQIQMNSKTLKSASLILALLAVCITPNQSKASGRIVVAFDDWTLADIGFFSPCEPGTFATNVAAWFTGGKPGRFLAWSTHPGYTGIDLSNAMASAGNTWVVDHTASFTLTSLMTYDGVFVGGDAADTNVLIQYVKAGGNVYVFSGGIGANPLWNG